MHYEDSSLRKGVTDARLSLWVWKVELEVPDVSLSAPPEGFPVVPVKLRILHESDIAM